MRRFKQVSIFREFETKKGIYDLEFTDGTIITFQADIDLEERYFKVGSYLGKSFDFLFTSQEEFLIDEIRVPEGEILNIILKEFSKDIDNYFYRRIAEFYFE